LPLGFLPYHNVNHNEAQQITKLGADMRVSMQSERLSGTGSLLTATNKDMDPALRDNRQAKTNNWVFPMLAIGAVLIGIGAVKI
jgi:hypothetical protein